MVWLSQLFKNFPHFVVIHTVKDFSIVNKSKIDVFLEFSCFFDDPLVVGNLISSSSVFSRLWRNRMGRPLSPLQIHQKII